MENAEAVKAVRDLTREIAVPQTGEKIHYLIAPAGSQLIDLSKQQYPHGLPLYRIDAKPKFQDSGSFVKYVNTFKDQRSRCFADAQNVNFTAMLDYHTPGDEGSEEAPEFLSHRASLQLQYSPEWRIWFGLHDKLVSQTDFAEHIEDNRADIVTPSPAQMLEVARDLSAHSEVNFASKVNLRNGTATLQYDEQLKASVANGSIEVPETFLIRIPVFFGGEAQAIEVKLRFRISDGKLKFQIKLYRPAEVIAAAFETTRAAIADQNGLDVLLGSL